jgi:hypothetical protein
VSSRAFSPLVALKKGGYVALSCIVGIVATVEAIGGSANLTHVSYAVGIGAIIGGVRAAINWYKFNKPND